MDLSQPPPIPPPPGSRDGKRNINVRSKSYLFPYLWTCLNPLLFLLFLEAEMANSAITLRALEAGKMEGLRPADFISDRISASLTNGFFQLYCVMPVPYIPPLLLKENVLVSEKVLIKI